MSKEKKRVALLSNVTVDLIVGKLRDKYDFYTPDGYDTWIQTVLDPDSKVYDESMDAVIVLLDGTEARSWMDKEEGDDRIATWKAAITKLTLAIKKIPVFVSTIDFRENRIRSFSERRYRYEHENIWYQFLQELIDANSYVYLLDLEETIADVGRKQFYSDKMWYLSSMPYSRDGLSAVSKEIDRALTAAFEARKKILVLDLDNTLWGGVIGEDGIDGIELSDHKEGQRYYDFQRQLLEMKRRGIVLAVDSKNNSEDAEDVLQNHPSMLLRKEDFVSRKINWENKTTNLKEIEREMNLTESGFVFIDDNPMEREMVKGECPEVFVPDFPTDTTELLSFAEELWADCCSPLRVLEEDWDKTKMYQAESKREQIKRNCSNLDDYIKRLEITVDIHQIRPDEMNRVVQLINKTNQFNLTSRRYSFGDIEKMNEDDKTTIYVVNSADRYGDNGLVGVMILVKEQGDIRIDTFLMSCRVMGRKLEEVIIGCVLSDKNTRIIGEYIPSAKNAPVRDLYSRLGFNKMAENDGVVKYVLDNKTCDSKQYEFYKEISYEG